MRSIWVYYFQPGRLILTRQVAPLSIFPSVDDIFVKMAAKQQQPNLQLGPPGQSYQKKRRKRQTRNRNKSSQKQRVEQAKVKNPPQRIKIRPRHQKARVEDRKVLKQQKSSRRKRKRRLGPARKKLREETGKIRSLI